MSRLRDYEAVLPLGFISLFSRGNFPCIPVSENCLPFKKLILSLVTNSETWKDRFSEFVDVMATVKCMERQRL